MDDHFVKRLSSPRRKVRDRTDTQLTHDLGGLSVPELAIPDTLSDFSAKSPPRKSASGDRYIPRRSETVDLHTQFSLLAGSSNSEAYSSLLRASLGSPRQALPASDLQQNQHLFDFSSTPSSGPALSNSLSPSRMNPSWYVSGSQRLAKSSAGFKQRKISTAPYKVLDAPNLQDDFYLNLVDWSSNNILAVALGASVYLWNAYTGVVTACHQYDQQQQTVTSVAWVQKGTHLAVGLSSGKVEIFDTNPCQRIRVMTGHESRVGSLCWNGCVLSSGSRDHKIINRDTTSPAPYTSILSEHKQEVCGLKWSPDGAFLASGGNDNKLMLWNASRSTTYFRKYSEHAAAVKAIAWSPHESDILVSGGGTADRTLRFWNVNQSSSFKCIDSGSQVCNLGWSQNVNEIVSTHGYSQNQIILWRYPSMTRLATLTGHTTRVLFLAISPDGQNIVTGAGDENLRFWHVWPAKKAAENDRDARGTFSPIGSQIR